MINTYKTREEAEKEKKRLNEKGPTFFCPLIKAKCNQDCVCYGEAHYIEKGHSDPKFIVYEGYCGNTMFTETEIVMS